jgi:redox-sensing transcriptional repressor
VIDPEREPRRLKTAPKAVVGRMSLYLRQLEVYQRQGFSTVSSSQLGQPLAIKNAQVRKDLAFFGQFGHPGIGYRIPELIQALTHILGIDHDWPLALVGLGNLGRALLRYRGFRTRGFHVVALFDNDPHKIGQKHDGIVVEPIESLRKVVAVRKINLAILCVPADAAQRVAEVLVASGIRGILNFAPVPITVPAHVNLVPVDLSVQLENLAYKVQKNPGEVSTSAAG